MLCNRSMPVWYKRVSSKRKLDVQVLLACLIGLFQIVGPSLCCCGPVCVVSKSATPRIVTIPNQNAIDHCPLCQAKSEQSTESKNDSKPQSPTRCPCAGLVLAPATPVSSASLEIIQSLNFWEQDRTVGLLDVPSVSANAESALDEHSVCDLPFLTTAMRLYAHHALRC